MSRWRGIRSGRCRLRRAPLRELGRRTLTNLYNERPQWLEDAHAELDATVAEAYGYEANISDRDALKDLLNINLGRQT